VPLVSSEGKGLAAGGSGALAPSGISRPKPAAAASQAAPRPVAAVVPATKPAAAAATNSKLNVSTSKPAAAISKPHHTNGTNGSSHHHAAANNHVSVELQQENLRLLTELNELKATLDGLEKERDFYFGKLRDIEVLCQEQESEGIPVVKRILDILYATAVSIYLFRYGESLVWSHSNLCSHFPFICLGRICATRRRLSRYEQCRFNSQ
jgi:hypothetical protein